MLDVITIVRNGEATISRMLQSLEAQKTIVHHIIIDGNSQDQTRNIIDSFTTKHKRLVVDQNGAGISRAFNQGIASSKREWILFLNADDWLIDFSLDEVLDFIETYHGAQIYCGGVNLYAPNGKFIASTSSNHNAIRRESSIHHAATIFHRTAFAQIGGFDEDFSLAMDYDWFLRAKQNQLQMSNMPVIVANRQLGGISNRRFLKAINETRKSRSRYFGFWEVQFWFYFACCKELAARFIKFIFPISYYQNYWNRKNHQINRSH